MEKKTVYYFKNLQTFLNNKDSLPKQSFSLIEETGQFYVNGQFFSENTLFNLNQLLENVTGELSEKDTTNEAVIKLYKLIQEVNQDANNLIKLLVSEIYDLRETTNERMDKTDKIVASGLSQHNDEIDKLKTTTEELKSSTDSLSVKVEDHLDNKDLQHIPAGGHERQILAWQADGKAKWENTSNVFTGLEDLLSYGVEWDVNVASPILTRIGNPLLHKSLPVQSAYKGCVAQKDKIMYWLDPDDWSKKENGENAVLDGTDGTVRVRTPKFYGKSEIDGDKRRVRISMMKIDDTWTEIPEMLVDAYRSTVSKTPPAEGFLSTLPANSAVSVVNTTANCRGGGDRSANDTYLNTDPYRSDLGKPRTNAKRSIMRTWARNAGSEMLSYEQYKWIFYWAYVIEYANFNCKATYNEELTADGYRQGGLGDGVTTWDGVSCDNYNGYSPLTPCGFGNEFGNHTGVKDLVIPETVVNETKTVVSKTFKMPRWRGFDNPFGDIYTVLDGILIDPNDMNYVYTTDNPEKYKDTFASIANMRLAGLQVKQNGFTKEFDLGTTGEIIPKVVGGSSTTYKCDFNLINGSLFSLALLQIGGKAYSGSQAGFGHFTSVHDVSYTDSQAGFRTVNVL